MKRHTLERDDDVDVSFEGEKIASVDSREYGKPDLSRWFEIHLYRTNGGKIVAHEIGNTKKPGERRFFQVYVCDTKEELVRKLGSGWPASCPARAASARWPRQHV